MLGAPRVSGVYAVVKHAPDDPIARRGAEIANRTSETPQVYRYNLPKLIKLDSAVTTEIRIYWS